MDFKLAILGAILIAICVIPVILIIRSSKKVERNLLQSLKRIAKQNNSHINLYDICGDAIIGIDENKNQIFFYKKTNETSNENVIELSKFQSCNISKTNRTLKKNSGNLTEIEKLELNFVPKSDDVNKISLEFFNVYESNQLSNEIQLIEKWSNLINNKLK